jgi:hypothetical protein
VVIDDDLQPLPVLGARRISRVLDLGQALAEGLVERPMPRSPG